MILVYIIQQQCMAKVARNFNTKLDLSTMESYSSVEGLPHLGEFLWCTCVLCNPFPIRMFEQVMADGIINEDKRRLQPNWSDINPSHPFIEPLDLHLDLPLSSSRLVHTVVSDECWFPLLVRGILADRVVV